MIKLSLRYRVSRKKRTHFSFCWILLVESILEAWNIFHFKDGNHKSIPSTKTFLFKIRKPRYKLNNIGYHIPKIWSIDIWYCHNLSLIFLILNSFEYWNISYFKGNIHRHLSTSNPVLHNMEERIYKENNIGYQFSRH